MKKENYEYIKKELIGKKIKSLTLSITFFGVEFLRKDNSNIMFYESEGGLYAIYIYFENNIVSSVSFWVQSDKYIWFKFLDLWEWLDINDFDDLCDFVRTY